MSEPAQGPEPVAEAALVIQPDRHLTYLLAKVEHQLTLALDRALHSTGLTLAQFNALANVHARPGLSSADLARFLLISPQAVGTLIRRLQRADLIEYEQRPRGHTGALQLTSNGLQRLRDAEQVAIETERRNLQALSETEQGAIHAQLTRLLKAIGKSDETTD